MKRFCVKPRVLREILMSVLGPGVITPERAPSQPAQQLPCKEAGVLVSTSTVSAAVCAAHQPPWGCGNDVPLGTAITQQKRTRSGGRNTAERSQRQFTFAVWSNCFAHLDGWGAIGGVIRGARVDVCAQSQCQ